VGKVVDSMQVGEISKPFRMVTDKQKEVIAVVKLRGRTISHKANLADDYQALKSMVEERKKEDLLNEWVEKKLKTTYVRIAEGWRSCDFQYAGWIRDIPEEIKAWTPSAEEDKKEKKRAEKDEKKKRKDEAGRAESDQPKRKVPGLGRGARGRGGRN
jgi:hypothetical protein